MGIGTEFQFGISLLPFQGTWARLQNRHPCISIDTAKAQGITIVLSNKTTGVSDQELEEVRRKLEEDASTAKMLKLTLFIQEIEKIVIKIK